MGPDSNAEDASRLCRRVRVRGAGAQVQVQTVRKVVIANKEDS